MSRQRSLGFRHITIVGVGLIGGSLGLAIKRRLRSAIVTGVDRAAVLRRARALKAIDRGETRLAAAVRDSDLVILATPLAPLLSLLSEVARHVRPDALVTDVGSVKQPIVERADRLFASGNFIGGHPMAGVEFTGIEAAHPLLFENALYVLTPTVATNRRQLRRLDEFLVRLGARVAHLDAGTHDRVAAVVSHLSQLVAVALVNVAGVQHSETRRYLSLAAGGFRDITRVASSEYRMWNDILALNRRHVDNALRLLEAELAVLRRCVQRGDVSRLRQRFASARRIRQAIPRTMKGFLRPLADIYVFVPDRPGVLAKMTTLLARAQINIKDIELLKIREGAGGSFRLSFDSTNVARSATSLLRKAGFEVNV